MLLRLPKNANKCFLKFVSSNNLFKSVEIFRHFAYFLLFLVVLVTIRALLSIKVSDCHHKQQPDMYTSFEYFSFRFQQLMHLIVDVFCYTQ